jgi:Flp pilus assembly protein TadD
VLGLLTLVALFAAVHANVGDFVRGEDANAEAIKVAEMGMLMEAVPLFQRAIELDPLHPDYHSNLGVTYMRLHNYPAARSAFNEALRINPSHRLTLDNLVELARFDGGSSGACRVRVADTLREPASPRVCVGCLYGGWLCIGL